MSAAEPTPVTTSYVRRIYSRAPLDSLHGGDPNPDPEYAGRQFDLWLAAHDEEVREAARVGANGPHTGQHLQGCVSCYAYVEQAERGMAKLRLNAEWSRRVAGLPPVETDSDSIVLDVNSLYPVGWRERAEFNALLVGPPTTGGLIRHRARRPTLAARLWARLARLAP